MCTWAKFAGKSFRWSLKTAPLRSNLTFFLLPAPPPSPFSSVLLFLFLHSFSRFSFILLFGEL